MSDFYTDKNKIVKEQKEIIGIIPVVDMRNFVKAFLAKLAEKTPIIYFNKDKSNIKTACLPLNYLESIEKILYEPNGWGIEFTEIINTYSYYEFQLEWETKFKRKIKEVLKELNKEYTYNIEDSYIKIEFTETEIKNILKEYNKDTLNIIDHFTNLIISYGNERICSINHKEYIKEFNRRNFEIYNKEINRYRNDKIMLKVIETIYDKEF